MLPQKQDLSARHTGRVRLLRPQRGAASCSCALADPAGPGRASAPGCRAAGAVEEGCGRDEAPVGEGRSGRSAVTEREPRRRSAPRLILRGRQGSFRGGCEVAGTQ